MRGWSVALTAPRLKAGECRPCSLGMHGGKTEAWGVVERASVDFSRRRNAHRTLTIHYRFLGLSWRDSLWWYHSLPHYHTPSSENKGHVRYCEGVLVTEGCSESTEVLSGYYVRGLHFARCRCCIAGYWIGCVTDLETELDIKLSDPTLSFSGIIRKFIQH